MNKSDEERFAKIMVATCEIYSKELSKTLIDLYFSTLSSHDIKSVADGFNRHIKDPKHGVFMPKPANIIYQIKTNAPEPLMIENKGGLEWCENTQKLLDTYLKQGRKLCTE